MGPVINWGNIPAGGLLDCCNGLKERPEVIFTQYATVQACGNFP